MKTLSLIIAVFFTVSSVSAQNNNGNGRRHYNNQSIVTVNVNSNTRNEIRIDGRDYGRGTNNVISITDLQPGQHTLQVIERRGIKGVLNGRGNTNATTTFNVREGYDMQITVNANGRTRIRETRSRNYRR
ncbi:MAG: hypothetical protein JWO92_2106 [Chitinophagaceae bacterium]|nr:hypothetical protein [Chitinophagaceae bacterium]